MSYDTTPGPRPVRWARGRLGRAAEGAAAGIEQQNGMRSGDVFARRRTTRELTRPTGPLAGEGCARQVLGVPNCGSRSGDDEHEPPDGQVRRAAPGPPGGAGNQGGTVEAG